MPERVDVLGRRPERAAAFTGALLSDELDRELQHLVARAADELSAPTALVSLVLERTQFFRAYYGLPEEVARTRGTERDVSFCQFVVRDGKPFTVEDAANDDRIPTFLLEHRGVRAYLGVPLVANDELVGALCVLDYKARGFTDRDVGRLARIGDHVNKRLAQLGEARSYSEIRDHASRPAFAGLRNLSLALTSGISYGRLIAADLAGRTRIAGAILTSTPSQEAVHIPLCPGEVPDSGRRHSLATEPPLRCFGHGTIATSKHRLERVANEPKRQPARPECPIPVRRVVGGHRCINGRSCHRPAI